MTDPKLLPNGDRLALRLLGHHLGMPEDELGHPYRLGEPYDLDGQTLHRIHDWNPLDDDGDAFRLLLSMPLRVSHGFNLGLGYAFVTHQAQEVRQADNYLTQAVDEEAEHFRARVRRALVFTALDWMNCVGIQPTQAVALESSGASA